MAIALEKETQVQNEGITQGASVSASEKGFSPNSKDFAETMETLHNVLQELKSNPLFKEPAEEVDNLYQRFQDQFRENRVLVVYVTPQQQQEKHMPNRQNEPPNLWKDFQTIHEDIKKASLDLKQSVLSIPQRMEAAVKEKIQQTIRTACGKVIDALNKGIDFLNRQREKVEAVSQAQQQEQTQPVKPSSVQEPPAPSEKGQEVASANTLAKADEDQRMSKSDECLNKILQPRQHTAMSASLQYRNEYKNFMEQGVPRQNIDEKVAVKMLLSGKYSAYSIKETIKRCSPEAALADRKEQYAKALLQKVQTREVKQQMQQAQEVGR